MNNLMNNEVLTMSSREIASIVDSRHDNVKRTMETLQLKGLIAFTQTEEKGNGRPATVYHVNKRDSYVVVAQLSPEFTAVLVDRWQELELNLQPQLPQTMAQALQLAADQAFQLEAQAPKVAFVDKYVSAETGNLTFRQVAKLLKIKENKFRNFLSDNKIMYNVNGSWAAYANHIEADRFTTNTGEANSHVFVSTYFTPKGVEWIAEQLNKLESK